MKKIGIVGLGIMGHGMAVNYQRHGYELFVWNRSAGKADDLVANGAMRCQTPREVAASADIVFEVTADDTVSRSVWFGNDGILAGSHDASVLIASSTLSLAYVDELIAACAERRRVFIDSPLTGSRSGAEGGTLKLLMGGDKEAVDTLRPEVTAIAEKVYHFGPAGSGMRFKLILNTLLAIQIDAAVQAKELARRAGLDVDAVHHALFDAPTGAASPATDMAFRGVPDPTDVNFSVKWIAKDLRYARAMAEQYDQDIDLLDVAQTDYAKAETAGLGDRDWTAIAELFKPRS